MSMAPTQDGEHDLAIRARPPSPKRLSRNILLAGSAAAGLVIAFALVNGLSERPERRGGAAQTAVAASGGPPQSIEQAASNYDRSDLPRGQLDDLSDPDNASLVAPEDRAWANTPPTPVREERAPPAAAPDPDQAARASPLLFAGHGASTDAGASDDGRLEARLTPPRSPYELGAGQVIPAALVTALNADLPGQVIAQVTAPVFDSVSGEHLLIPQGSRLIGAYASNARYGDHRILLSWHRLILPNGWSINLGAMQASDPSGASGLSDTTDNHLGRLTGAIGLSAIISVIANEAEDNQSGSFSQSVGDAAAQQAAQTGSRIVDRELSVHPTLRVRAGAPVRVLVTRDIVFR